MTELLPCPFCKSKAELLTFWDFYKFSCKNADCTAHVADAPYVQHADGAWFGSIDEARASWNARAYTTDELTLSGMYAHGLPIEDVRVFGMTLDEVRQMMKRDAERERTCHADEVTHRNCKYSVNRGWRERTCHIEYPYYGDAPVINGQPRCSECKTEFAVGTFPHYCPNCGARVTKTDQNL